MKEPGNYEVIVVDDCSTDGTAHVARKKGARVIETDRNSKGPWYPRNLGGKEAKGDTLYFIDADSYPLSGWRERIEERVREGTFIIGRILYTDENFNFNTRLSFVNFLYHLENIIMKVGGPNISINREDFLKTDGFRPVWPEEIYFISKSAKVLDLDYDSRLRIKMISRRGTNSKNIRKGLKSYLGFPEKTSREDFPHKFK